MKILENPDVKIITSEDYNSIYNKHNGFFARWGKTEKDDPIMAPMPEILDLEISQGKCSGKCPECYKCNGDVEETYNMSFDKFKRIFHKVAQTVVEMKFKDHRSAEFSFVSEDLSKGDIYKDCLTKQDIINKELEYLDQDEVAYIKVYNEGLLTQIAFGICDLDTNPDFLKMMKYCREFDVTPNFTFNGNGLTDKWADEISKLCGSVAISVYNKEKAYNAVKMLTDRGMNQINFHVITHNKSYDKIMSIMDDIKSDKRLEKLNALVLLRYKPKGNGKGKFHQLSLDKYEKLINYSIQKGVSIGFDSCSAPVYLEIIKRNPKLKDTEILVEPCESSLFSSYINCHGEFYACSFCEKEKHTMWETGIDVDFNSLKDVWYNKKTETFRNLLLRNNRNCPMFNLEADYE